MRPRPVITFPKLDVLNSTTAEASAHFQRLADYHIDLMKWYEELCLTIQREVEGCGPDCSKDFLRLGLTSVRDLARLGVRTALQHGAGHE
jgi:hypothetical protein